MQNDVKEIKLTEYAHGAGCGCKIAPQVLSEILSATGKGISDKHLLVGNDSNDDAAVYDLGNGQALISTTDFFMPIVDDAFDFGRVAAANAISDVYAMGGKPLLALAILGWPVDKLPAELASKVIEGARTICTEAGITLAGGHSIDTTEPMFGLAVNGIVQTDRLKKNNTAKEGDLIYMTKALGSGILSTARKRKVLRPEDEPELMQALTTLNNFGEELGKTDSVSAMTDITGFGLLGHLIEICKGSGLSAEISFSAIPKMKSLPYYIAQSVMPDATFRNWNAYNKEMESAKEIDATQVFMTMPDPQTNGGLLFTVNAADQKNIEQLMINHGLADFAKPIGKMQKASAKTVLLQV